METDIIFGNPYVAVETICPDPPWTDEDLGSHESVDAFLDRATLPVAGDRGFWFAFHDRDERHSEVRLFTDVARPGRVVPMERRACGLHTLRFPAPEVDRLEYSLQLVGDNGHVEWINDPRNARTVESPFGAKSEAVAPDYAPPDYVTFDGDYGRGTLRKIPVPGPRGNIRSAYVWRAVGKRLEDRLPLIVFLDGVDYVNFGSLRSSLDKMVALGRIEPCRALFLPPSRDRFDEYSANGRTAAWLTNVLPRILARYFPVPRQAERRIGVGASLGGLALLHAHWTRPGFFGKLVLQSGSFFYRDSDAMESAFSHFGRITRFVRSVSRKRRRAMPIPVRMTCGIAEENLVNNRRMLAVLSEQGYDATLTEQRDAHNWIAWRDSIGSELTAVQPG